MAKADFPPELLVATGGRITGRRGQFSIRLELAPFTFDGERVEQALDFCRVSLQAQEAEALAGRAVVFPANPEPGYVESSLYLWSVHNPVDLRRVTFGEAHGGAIAAEFDLRFVFDYEGACNPLDLVLRASLQMA